MSAFDEDWLQLREPIDAASRARGPAGALARAMPERPIEVVDLATGTGANLRYLAPALGGAQSWTLIDRDPDLLEVIPAHLAAWARGCGAAVAGTGPTLTVTGPGFDCRVRMLRADLAAELDAIDWPHGALVSASALLDLVSAPWLEALSARCAKQHAPVLFAMTYDGRVVLDPAEPEDRAVIELVNRHQLGDKGFGQALGPSAGPRAAEILRRLGYAVDTARSDWRLAPSDAALQRRLLDGWLAAAVAIAPAERTALERWADRRRAHIAGGRSAMRVGHVDLLGRPGR